MLALLVIVLICIILYVLLFRPDPIKYLIKRYLMHQLSYGEDELNVKGYSVIKSSETRESLINPENAWLHYLPNAKNDKLIVVIIGGAFMFSTLNAYYGFCRVLLETLNDESFSLLLLSYPVRWAATMYESMQSINNTLRQFHQNFEYKKYHFIGFSAGALYTGTFINKEYNRQYAEALELPRLGILANSCTLVNPMIDATSFDNPILRRVFNWYIARGTKHANKYSCLGQRDGLGQQNVPVLAITSNKDILYQQARLVMRYMPNSETKIFVVGDKTLPHSFVQQIDCKESREAINLIVQRLKTKW